MKHIVTDKQVGVGTIFVEQQTHDHSFYTLIINKSIKVENRPKDKCLLNPEFIWMRSANPREDKCLLNPEFIRMRSASPREEQDLFCMKLHVFV